MKKQENQLWFVKPIFIGMALILIGFIAGYFSYHPSSSEVPVSKIQDNCQEQKMLDQDSLKYGCYDGCEKGVFRVIKDNWNLSNNISDVRESIELCQSECKNLIPIKAVACDLTGQGVTNG